MSVQTLLGFVLSLGRHFWHLPHSAVGEALAYFQKPVGQPQSPSPPSSFRGIACSPITSCYFPSLLMLEGFSPLSARHYYLGYRIPSFFCREGPDFPVLFQVHPSEGGDSQAPSEPLGNPALLLHLDMQQA